MNNSDNSTVRQIGGKLLSLLDQEKGSKEAHLTLDDISNIFKENSDRINDLTSILAKIRLALYIEARHLKSSFFEESILEAKKRNSFFKFTVNVNFRKDIFDFDNCKIKEPEKAGTLESIYWSKRNGRKIEGKIKYFITRIPLNDPDGIIYKRKAFAGEAKWQVDLIMKYEERFAQIRKATKVLGEFKRKTRQLNIYLGDITKTLNDMESTELNSTITNEENGYNEVNDLTEDK